MNPHPTPPVVDTEPAKIGGLRNDVGATVESILELSCGQGNKAEETLGVSSLDEA